MNVQNPPRVLNPRRIKRPLSILADFTRIVAYGFIRTRRDGFIRRNAHLEIKTMHV
jgi:hypothetical protein